MILEPASVLFKTTLFLLSMAVEMSPAHITVEVQMQIFTCGYNLDACFVHCMGGNFHHCVSKEKNKEVLGEWLHIFDNLS